MHTLVSAIVAGVFAAVTFSILAADPVKTDPNPGAKPGRQIDDTVKSGGNLDKPGRAADEQAPAKKDTKKKKKKKEPTQ
jgi:hypothetical protein